jgi:hypothetical protein
LEKAVAAKKTDQSPPEDGAGDPNMAGKADTKSVNQIAVATMSPGNEYDRSDDVVGDGEDLKI